MNDNRIILLAFLGQVFLYSFEQEEEAFTVYAAAMLAGVDVYAGVITEAQLPELREKVAQVPDAEIRDMRPAVAV